MFSKLTLMSVEEQQKLHEATLELLEKVGVVLGSEDVRKILEEKGA